MGITIHHRATPGRDKPLAGSNAPSTLSPFTGTTYPGAVYSGGKSAAAEMLQIAESNTQRLVRLANDILDLDKIDHGKLELITERINYRALVTETLLDLTRMASESEVKLIHDYDE